MADLLIRDLLRSSIHAAKKRGEIIIRQGYEPTPATLAGLLLEQTKGNPDEALRMLVQMANYLRAVQREPERAPESSDPATGELLADRVTP